jgi:hypothetical protein
MNHNNPFELFLDSVKEVYNLQQPGGFYYNQMQNLNEYEEQYIEQ